MSDWQLTTLGSLGNFSKGRGITKNELVGEGINAVRYGELYTKHNIKIRSIYSFISRESTPSAKRIRFGDVLFAGSGETAGEIGKAAVYMLDEECYAGGDVIIFRPNPDCNPLFLSYLLNTQNQRMVMAKLGQGNSVVHIYKHNLESMTLKTPPLFEQGGIVDILEKWDEYLENLDKKIEIKRSIKKGLMQQIFSQKIRFKSESGNDYPDWGSTRLEDCVVPGGLVRGPFGSTLRKSNFTESGYKVYEQRDAIKETRQGARYFIGRALFDKLRRFQVYSGDFIVSCSGTIGQIRLIDEGDPKGVMNQALLKIRIDDAKINKGYFHQYFMSDYLQSKILGNTQGGAIQNLVGMDVFRSTTVLTPDMEEQKKINEALSSLDEQVSHLEDKRDIVEKQREYLLNNLVAGKIRASSGSAVDEEVESNA